MAIPLVFPLDSGVIGIGSNGLPIYTNQYTSKDYRNVLKKFFHNGVFSNSALAVVPQMSSNNTNAFKVYVSDGSAVVDGALFTLPATTVIDGVVRHSQTDGIEYVGFNVVIRLDTRNANELMELDVISSEPTNDDDAVAYPPVMRSGGLYDIVLSRFVIGMSYISSTNRHSMFLVKQEDTRLIPELCGIATPYVQFDTTAFGQELDYIVEATEEKANSAIQKLENQTNVALELAQDALDENVAGAIYSDIAELQTELDTKQFDTNQIMDGAVTGSKLASHIIDVGNVFQATSDFDLYTQYVDCIEYGKLLVVNMAFVANKAIAEGSVTTIGQVKNPYRPLMTSYVMCSHSEVAVVNNKINGGAIEIVPTVDIVVNSRVWIRGMWLFE